MKPVIKACAAAMLATLSMRAHAVTEDNFLAKTTGDVIALCSADPSEKMMTAAVNFCHGFVVGAYRVLAAEDETLGKNKAFCPPATLPSRNEAIASFITWSKTNPSVNAMPPTDGMLEYLMAAYPCAAK